MPVEGYNTGARKRSYFTARVRLHGCWRLVVSILLVCVLPSFAGAQDLPWRHVLERTWSDGYELPALVYDYSDPTGQSWYTLQTGAAWHTADLGVTMTPISQDGMDNQIWSGLAVAYHRPDILYASTGSRGYNLRETHRFPGNGVYRSGDKGRSWSRLPFFPGIEDLDDLHYLTNIITSAAGDTVIVATNKRILRSRDSGQSWDVVHVLEQVPNPVTGGGALQTRLTLLYHHPASMGTIFAVVRGHDGSTYGSTINHYALISRDGGASWEQLVVDGWEVALDQNSGERSRSEWRFAHDPADPDIFWLHAKHPTHPLPGQRYGRKFYRSADGGENWDDIPALLKQGRDTTDFNTDIVNYSGEDYFYVHPLGGDTLVFGLSVGHYRESGNLFFDGRPTGINPLLLPAPDTFLRFRWVRLHQINTHPPNQFAIMWEEEEYVATYLFSGEFPNAYVYDACKSIGPPYDPFDLTAPPWTPWVYLVGSTRDRIPVNPGGRAEEREQTRAGQGAAKHSPDPPAGLTSSAIYTWNRLCHPDRYDLLRGGIVSWGLNRRTGITRDTADDYEETAPPVGRVLKLSPSKQQPDRVWAATRDGDPTLTGLWRSDDYSDTWEMVHADPLIETVHVHEADDQVIYTNRSVSRDGGGSWEDRTVPEEATIRSQDRMRSHSQDTSILYVCHSNGGLRRWTDYLQADTLMAPSETYGFCRDLFVFPDTPERMWLGSDKGLFETLDGGETWERRNRGLPNAPITRIVIAPDRSEIMVGILAYGLFVVDANEVGIVPVHRVGTEDPGELPESGVLLTNYPNPFVDETQLRFTTEKPGHVRLEVFDVLGRQVATATDQLYGGGSHQVRFSGAGLTSGVYLVRLQVDGRIFAVQKMVRR